MNEEIINLLSRNSRFDPWSRAYYTPAYDCLFVLPVESTHSSLQAKMDIALECGHRLVNQFTSIGLFVFDLEAEGTNLLQFRKLHQMRSETMYRILQCLNLSVEAALSSYEILDETFSAIWAYLLLKKHKETLPQIAEMEQQLFSTYPLCKEPYEIARGLADLYSYQIYEIFQTAAMVNLQHLLASLSNMVEHGWTPNYPSLPQDEEWPDGRIALFLNHCAEETSRHPLGIKRVLPKEFLMSRLFKTLSKEFSNRFGMADLDAKMKEGLFTMFPEIFMNTSAQLFNVWQSKMSFLRNNQRKNWNQNRRVVPGVTAIPANTLMLLNGQFYFRIGWKHEKFSSYGQEIWKQHFNYTIVKRAVLERKDDCPLRSFVDGCQKSCEHEGLIASLLPA